MLSEDGVPLQATSPRKPLLAVLSERLRVPEAGPQNADGHLFRCCGAAYEPPYACARRDAHAAFSRWIDHRTRRCAGLRFGIEHRCATPDDAGAAVLSPAAAPPPPSGGGLAVGAPSAGSGVEWATPPLQPCTPLAFPAKAST